MANNANTFEDAAYPVITLVGGLLVILFLLFSNKSKLGMTGKNGGFMTVILSIALLACFVFFTFGPDRFRRLSHHFLCLGVMGIFAVATGGKSWCYVILVFGMITFISQLGLAGIIFGYNTFLHRVDTSGCNNFFNPASDLPVPARDYCKEDGYLQFLRVIANVSYFVVPAFIASVWAVAPGGNGSVAPKNDAAPAEPTSAV